MMDLRPYLDWEVPEDITEETFCPNQMTREEAVAFAQSGQGDHLDDEALVRLQMFQRRLCVDFSTFHGAVERVLGRPVWTHEFGTSGRKALIEEYLGKRPQATMQDVMDKIPDQDKTVVVGL